MVQRRIWDVMGSLIINLVYIYWEVCQWKNVIKIDQFWRNMDKKEYRYAAFFFFFTYCSYAVGL